MPHDRTGARVYRASSTRVAREYAHSTPPGGPIWHRRESRDRPIIPLDPGSLHGVNIDPVSGRRRGTTGSRRADRRPDLGQRTSAPHHGGNTCELARSEYPCVQKGYFLCLPREVTLPNRMSWVRAPSPAVHSQGFPTPPGPRAPNGRASGSALSRPASSAQPRGHVRRPRAPR